MEDNQVELLGRLAVHYRMISREQLQFALRHRQRQPGALTLKEALFELRLLTQNQLAQLERAAQDYITRKRSATEHPGQYTSKRPGAPAPPPPPPPGPPAVPTLSTMPPDDAAPFRGAADRPREKNAVAAKAAQKSPPGVSQRHLEWLKRVLHHATKLGASDVHVHANAPVRIRLVCELSTINPEPLRATEAEATLRACLTEDQASTLDEHGDVDLTFDLPQVARFRVNIYREHHGLCGVFHRIPLKPPTLSQLGLPAVVGKLTHHRNGLLLVTGPAGAGKTSTLAALISLINDERTDHVITLEDPIEYRHLSNRSLINQRELGRHTHSYQAALHAALREDPDVICIGELRDIGAIELALTAAETGHLVIATMSTMGGIRTLHRLVGGFPPSQQARVRSMLAESLRAILSQKLLPNTDRSDVVLAYELLLANQAVTNLIREGRVYQLANLLQTSRSQGMQAFDESLLGLLQEGVIHKDTARRHAENPALFR